MVAGGDETHRDALKSMQDRWKHPLSGMGGYTKTKKAFAALPEASSANSD
jgi:predicted polyphosphate/ATP-dependent NAD kinase